MIFESMNYDEQTGSIVSSPSGERPSEGHQVKLVSHQSSFLVNLNLELLSCRATKPFLSSKFLMVGVAAILAPHLNLILASTPSSMAFLQCDPTTRAKA